MHRDKWPSLVACPSGNRWCTKYVGHGTHPRTKTHVNLEHVASSVVGGSTDVALMWLVGERHETERRDAGADAVGGRGLPLRSGKSKGARWKELRKPRDAIPKAAATAPSSTSATARPRVMTPRPVHNEIPSWLLVPFRLKETHASERDGRALGGAGEVRGPPGAPRGARKKVLEEER